MIRLPDVYYTKQMLDGNPEQTGLYQPPPQFSQGEDIIFDVFLNFDGKPVDENELIVEVFVKKSTFADNVLFHGVLGDGLYPRQNNVVGLFQVWMPSSITATFLPGTYYLGIQVKEKIGHGAGVKDRTAFIHQSLFNIGLGTPSPNPKLRPSTVQEVSYDIESGVTTITRTGVEPTLPHAVDPSAQSGRGGSIIPPTP